LAARVGRNLVSNVAVLLSELIVRRGTPTERRTEMLAKFFNAFWGWADYRPKDWSNAPYKRGYAS
jgi:hypothetical protein